MPRRVSQHAPSLCSFHAVEHDLGKLNPVQFFFLHRISRTLGYNTTGSLTCRDYKQNTVNVSRTSHPKHRNTLFFQMEYFNRATNIPELGLIVFQTSDRVFAGQLNSIQN